jgi:hypothetical protein
MIDFAAALTAAGPAPMYGDADDGYVLDLGGVRDGLELVAMGRALLHGPAARSVERCEPVAWLFDEQPPLEVPPPPVTLRATAFEDTGLYLLQYGEGASSDSASLTFDCGELGFGAIAAHGHADALAVSLRAGGHEVLVDPGTYDYFRYPAWRDYFRGTRAHNTVVVDGVDQSVMLGPFMWGERAAARCLEWDASGDRTRVAGEHDGYAHLADPVRHRRTITLIASDRTFEIVDELAGGGVHDLELPFHLAPDVAVRPRGDGVFDLETPAAVVRLSIDPRLAARVERGVESPIAGWVSSGYHRRAPAATIRATLRGTLPIGLTTRIQVSPRGTGA